jgi:hypothetical protein
MNYKWSGVLPGNLSFKLFAVFLLPLALLSGCDSDNDNNNDGGGGEPEGPRASAREVRDADDLLQGPLARGSEGDYVLENERLRIIIQKPGRNWFGLGTYGGNIIDASRRNDDGSFNPDHLEEFITGLNIENTPNFTDVTIENDGDDGAAAMICVSGPDDLIEIVNASSAIRNLGANFPDSADDRDLPIEVQTCYSLGAEDDWVTMDTTVTNKSADPLAIFMVEYLNGSGEVEAFQPNAGFGELQVTRSCPENTYVACNEGQCDQCNYLAYTGNGGALGVSYGLIHEVSGSSSFSTDGVSVLVLGQSVIDLLLGEVDPNFEIPGEGELNLRRYFAVGDGNASRIGDIRNEIFGYETGQLSGAVTSGGTPLANADVSVFRTLNGNTEPPTRFVVSHSRTGTDGTYTMTLPPGDYEVQAHKEGFLYASEDPVDITLGTDQALEQDFDLPAPGMLQVSVTAVSADGQDEPVPAKLQLVGFDPAPPLLNNVLGSAGGVFGDSADRLPFGISLVEFIDRSGISDVYMVEPGDYQVVVSRGPRYSAFSQRITITSGQTTEVQAEIARIVDTPGLISADFHVHSIDSIDAEVTREERVATYLAEGVDFFTPSDHGMRTDFTATLLEMDVADLIGTAPSAEISPFDYGHFNSWPVTLDDTVLSNGSVDWGGAALPGEDFPAYGSYSLPPAEIFAQSLADPKDNIVQINHINGHFGGGGLAIDTGLTPPQSQIDLTQRRLDPNLGNAFDDGFQALEVWIGTDGRNGIFDAFLGQNAGDWFNLINQGMVRTGVADSDSHDRRITFLATRNLIASEVTDPGQLSGQAEELAASIAAGRNVGTNGPAVTMEARARYVSIERVAGLGVGQSTTVPVSSGTTATVTVNIATPTWAPVDSVDFYINNQPEKTSAAGAAARYGVCPDVTISAGDPGWEAEEVTVVEGLEGAVRTEITVTLDLPRVEEDTWIIAMVKGTDGVSSPMFPVVPEDLDPTTNQTLDDLLDGNLGEGGVPAFAFTNPLFLDVGNNGWTAPGVANAPCAE